MYQVLLFLSLLLTSYRVSSADLPANDICENAIVLGINDDITTSPANGPTQQGDGVVLWEQTIQGSTIEASHGGLNLCGENLISSPGLCVPNGCLRDRPRGDDNGGGKYFRRARIDVYRGDRF